MLKTAEISNCETYRYQLKRQWESEENLVLFICLNPATADAENNDKTCNRYIEFAKEHGYSGLIITNVFAFRSEFPNEMKNAENPVGLLNDEWIIKSIRLCKAIVVGWGNDGAYQNRDIEVLKILKEHGKDKLIFCLGKNTNGQPSHPSRLTKGTKFQPFDIYTLLKE